MIWIRLERRAPGRWRRPDIGISIAHDVQRLHQP